MKQIKLYEKANILSDKVALVDDEDYEYLNSIKWYVHIGGYTYGSLKGKQVYMHRLVNNTPEGVYTDHINRNKLDNRKENLRNCTPLQNNHNSKRQTGEVKYRGVTYDGRKTKAYVARIKINKYHQHLGIFHTAEEAALAYNDAAYIYHGEFAILNKIEDMSVIEKSKEKQKLIKQQEDDLIREIANRFYNLKQTTYRIYKDMNLCHGFVYRICKGGRCNNLLREWGFPV